MYLDARKWTKNFGVIMAFKIVNETYECLPNENPEKYGYISLLYKLT